MKRFISTVFVLAMLVAVVASAIPAGAADYANEGYFRYPASATYEALTTEEGMAKGMLTVKASAWVNNNSDGCRVDAVAFWANANGPLEGYSHLARFKLSTVSTTFTFPELQMIPAGADRLRVYTSINGTNRLSTQYADAMLPENWDYIPAGDPLQRFVVISDTHIVLNDTAKENRIFMDMLDDVSSKFSDASGIFINGDNIDSTSMFATTGTDIPEQQFAKLKEYGETLCPDIPLFMAIGNHDLWPTGDRDKLKTIFTAAATLPDGSHPTSIHYDFWIDNCHFVMVGDDDGDPNYATLSAASLSWLDATLAKGDEVEGSRTFIFLHQGFSNTVAGTLVNFGQEWDGVVNLVEVRSVLSKYPDAVLFSGHSHYSMDSVSNAFDGGLAFPTTFNTASLSRIDSSSTEADEAQGYIVEVYEKAILVRGYDFANDEWKASAQYVVDYGAERGERPVYPQSKPNDTPNNNNSNNNNTNVNTNNNNTNKVTDKPTDTTASQTTAEEVSSGCGSAILTSATSIAVVAAISTVCCAPRSKKKRNG